MKTWTTLIRREFWENRALWIAPALAAVFMIIGAIAIVAQFGDMDFGRRRMPGTMPNFGNSSEAYAISVFVFASLIMIVGGFALTTYVMDCLYSERRDRSILFWKSLPVSDSQTVLSKLIVALVVTPLGLFALAVVTHMICGAIISINPPGNMPALSLWRPAELLRAYGWLGACVAVNALWYAPLAAYGMLASVIAPRSPFLFAFLPPVLVFLGERFLLGTSTAGIWMLMRSRPRMDLQQVLATPELYLGLVAAALLILVVIRLRRWRDDS